MAPLGRKMLIRCTNCFYKVAKSLKLPENDLEQLFQKVQKRAPQKNSLDLLLIDTPFLVRFNLKIPEENPFPSLNQDDFNRLRGMSVSSFASRDSVASISSFSSSLMIDKIFNWKRHSSKSMKSPDSELNKSFRKSEIEFYQKNGKKKVCDSWQDQQIDKLAAESLASFNGSVVEEVEFGLVDSCYIEPKGVRPTNRLNGEDRPMIRLPEKPLRFHIKQLELVLNGLINPSMDLDANSVQLRLDSLKVRGAKGIFGIKRLTKNC